MYLALWSSHADHIIGEKVGGSSGNPTNQSSNHSSSSKTDCIHGGRSTVVDDALHDSFPRSRVEREAGRKATEEDVSDKAFDTAVCFDEPLEMEGGLLLLIFESEVRRRR